MLGLPASTECNRRIPKQKFYEKSELSPALKKAFSAQIASIHWRNKIAPEVLNLAAGKEVQELEVFELRLNDGQVDEAVLRLIDRAIPYHILFVLVWEDRMRLAIAYKETPDAKSTGVRVERYYYRTGCLWERSSCGLRGCRWMPSMRTSSAGLRAVRSEMRRHRRSGRASQSRAAESGSKSRLPRLRRRSGGRNSRRKNLSSSRSCGRCKI